jgi:heme/copper-type cytochrome/quinol oxidase subunit 3
MDGALSREPLPMPALPRRRQVVPSSVLGTLIAVVALTMFFAGMISALTISRANQLPGMWPPPGQPLLPASAAALNTALLLASGVALLVANWQWKARITVARLAYMVAWTLGAVFLALQVQQAQALQAQGLSVTSSTLGSFFFIIVGGHGLHVLGSLVALAWGGFKLMRGTLTSGLFFGLQTFWYFVVLLWPVIYARVYF